MDDILGDKLCVCTLWPMPNLNVFCQMLVRNFHSTCFYRIPINLIQTNWNHWIPWVQTLTWERSKAQKAIIHNTWETWFKNKKRRERIREEWPLLHRKRKTQIHSLFKSTVSWYIRWVVEGIPRQTWKLHQTETLEGKQAISSQSTWGSKANLSAENFSKAIVTALSHILNHQWAAKVI